MGYFVVWTDWTLYGVLTDAVILNATEASRCWNRRSSSRAIGMRGGESLYRNASTKWSRCSLNRTMMIFVSSGWMCMASFNSWVVVFLVFFTKPKGGVYTPLEKNFPHETIYYNLITRSTHLITFRPLLAFLYLQGTVLEGIFLSMCIRSTPSKKSLYKESSQIYIEPNYDDSCYFRGDAYRKFLVYKTGQNTPDPKT